MKLKTEPFDVTNDWKQLPVETYMVQNNSNFILFAKYSGTKPQSDKNDGSIQLLPKEWMKHQPGQTLWVKAMKEFKLSVTVDTDYVV